MARKSSNLGGGTKQVNTAGNPRRSGQGTVTTVQPGQRSSNSRPAKADTGKFWKEGK